MERTSTTTANERHELDDYDQYHSTPNEVDNGTSSPAADGGKAAWLFLAACFICEALIWGKKHQNIMGFMNRTDYVGFD